jgi:diadenosine tetraphosphate (Ap4A) HIT family hydrolase
MHLDNCDFCVEFSGREQSKLRCIYPPSLPPRLIFRDGGFNVFPCLGAIEFGHLLISTVRHYTSFSQVPEADREAFGSTVERVVRGLTHHFGRPPTLFEHGDPTGLCEVQGPCISHAHLHVAPSGQPILDRLWRERMHLASAPLVGPAPTVDQPYLMCTDGRQVAHYFSAQGTPRQYLRQVYAEALNRPDDWNWAVTADVSMTSEQASALRRLI